jgi:hypothetical protein
MFVPSLSWQNEARFSHLFCFASVVVIVFLLQAREEVTPSLLLIILPLLKTAFLSHLYIKPIILPRQARDKHRENSKKRCRFSHLLLMVLKPSARKRSLFVSAFPMFVPSLSW